MFELLVLLVPLVLASAGDDAPPVVVDPAKPSIPGYSLHEMPNGTWQVAQIFANGDVHFDGPYQTEAVAKLAAENWLASYLGGQQGGVAPQPPDVPPVCAQIITVTADNRTGTLCKQGAHWRLYRDGDRLLPARFVDPGKAAQRMITLLHANDAAIITIETSTAWAELRRLGGGQYGWRVQSTTPAQPGGVGVSTSASGVEPSLLDAMGSAYEAAGGI